MKWLSSSHERDPIFLSFFFSAGWGLGSVDEAYEVRWRHDTTRRGVLLSTSWISESSDFIPIPMAFNTKVKFSLI